MKVQFEFRGRHLAVALAVAAGVCWFVATQFNVCAGMAVTFGLLFFIVREE